MPAEHSQVLSKGLTWCRTCCIVREACYALNRRMLELFTQEHADRLGVKLDTLILTGTDPAVEMDAKLLQAVEQTGADLVVMASHKPGISDRLHLIGSNAAHLVSHSAVSVFVVR